MRGLNFPQSVSIFERWFAPLTSLPNSAFLITHHSKELSAGAVDLFMMEVVCDSENGPGTAQCATLYAERLIDRFESERSSKPSGSRRLLRLDPQYERAVLQYAAEGGGKLTIEGTTVNWKDHTRVVFFLHDCATATATAAVIAISCVAVRFILCCC